MPQHIDICREIELESRKAFFDLIKCDLQDNPPNTSKLYSILDELIDGLCRFVPSKTSLHLEIKKIKPHVIDIQTMPMVVHGLIDWIEKFQAPVDDKITKNWRIEFDKSQNYPEFISRFLSEYYEHTEHVYSQTFDARKRLFNGESVIPPEHRSKAEGKDGIPSKMKTG